MIDPTAQTAASALPPVTGRPKPVFKMIASDRMAGSVPAWVTPTGAQEQTLAALSRAESGGTFAEDLSNAMAYGPQDTNTATAAADSEPFGFGDLVDIVNPLQQLPLVGNLYRAVTGDTIRPSSQIIGGAVYGGLAGAASGIANVIMKEETGKTLAEHAVALVEGGTSSASPSTSAMKTASNEDHPLERLARAETTAHPELPGTALSFADLGASQPKPAAPVSKLASLYRFNE